MVLTESLPSIRHFREKVWEERVGTSRFNVSQTLIVAVSRCAVIPEHSVMKDPFPQVGGHMLLLLLIQENFVTHLPRITIELPEGWLGKNSVDFREAMPKVDFQRGRGLLGNLHPENQLNDKLLIYSI